jgi:transposase
MKPTRRRFTREFKLEVVRQLASGRRQADVARELGVDAQVIRRWKDQVKIDAATAFPGNGRRARKEEELQRLRREVTQLRAERDFLKKAAAFFAKTSR